MVNATTALDTIPEPTTDVPLKSILCPDCDRGLSNHTRHPSFCTTCDGTGEIVIATPALIAAAKQLAAERRARQAVEAERDAAVKALHGSIAIREAMRLNADPGLTRNV